MSVARVLAAFTAVPRAGFVPAALRDRALGASRSRRLRRLPDGSRPLADQLTLGGRLVQPIGTGRGDEVVLFTKRDRDLERTRVGHGCTLRTAVRAARVRGR